MSEPSDAAVNEERVNDFREHCNRLRHKSDLNEVERISRLSKICSFYLNLTASARREEIMEAQVTRALVHGATGGDGAGPSRAELEAKVRDLELKVAALEGKVSVLQEDRDTIREKLFAMLGAGTKQ